MNQPKVSNWLPPLCSTPDNLIGVEIFCARHQWRYLSSDKWIIDVVHGKVLDFEGVPNQNKVRMPLNLLSDPKALTSAMTRFIEQQIVERCGPGDRGFISNIFPTINRDRTAIVINEELDNYVKHVHFKMDTVKDVISLLKPRYFFVSADLKDASYSVC